MQQVGKKNSLIGTSGTKRYFSYRDITYDEDKWADASKYLPADFDLCLLKTDKKTYPGWYTGSGWDGKKHDLDENVKCWRLFS